MPGHIRKREVVVRKQERIDTQPFPGARAVQIGMAIDQIKRNIVSRSDAAAHTALPVSNSKRQRRISCVRQQVLQVTLAKTGHPGTALPFPERSLGHPVGIGKAC